VRVSAGPFSVGSHLTHGDGGEEGGAAVLRREVFRGIGERRERALTRARDHEIVVRTPGRVERVGRGGMAQTRVFHAFLTRSDDGN